MNVPLCNLALGFDLVISARSAVKTAHEMLPPEENRNRWLEPCGTFNRRSIGSS